MKHKIIYEKLGAFLSKEKIKLQEPMKDHTSFRIGGPAEIMIFPTQVKEVQGVVSYCNKSNTPLMVMGNGTNLLISDKGIKGIVMKLAQNFNDVKVCGTKMTCKAGVSLSSAAKAALDHELTGLEFAHGIPGSIGGAAVMNAGAFDGDMAKVVEEVIAMDLNGDIYNIPKEDIQYSYRNSIFQRDKMILLEVKMNLENGVSSDIKDKMQNYLAKRKEKQPLNLASAGSAFKRPVGNYAGYLIEKSGLKGFRIGDAMVSDLHAGFIVNLGNATFNDMVKLITHVQATVREKFQVDLEPEIKIIDT